MLGPAFSKWIYLNHVSLLLKYWICCHNMCTWCTYIFCQLPSAELVTQEGWQDCIMQKFSLDSQDQLREKKITQPLPPDSKMMSPEGGCIGSGCHCNYESASDQVGKYLEVGRRLSWNVRIPPQSHNSSFKFLYKFPPSKLCSSTLRRPNFFFLLS